MLEKRQEQDGRNSCFDIFMSKALYNITNKIFWRDSKEWRNAKSIDKFNSSRALLNYSALSANLQDVVADLSALLIITSSII